MHGEGIFRKKEDPPCTFKGTWENNEVVGKGTFIRDSKEEYEVEVDKEDIMILSPVEDEKIREEIISQMKWIIE